jgi:hypothetical protein
MGAKPVFSEMFRSRLRKGKYSRWAENIDEDTLESLFWMIGEIGYVAHPSSTAFPQPVLIPNRKFNLSPVTTARIEAAISTVNNIYAGKRLNIQEAMEIIYHARSE